MSAGVTSPWTEAAAAALRLERALGDPRDEGRPLSFARALERDERGRYPSDEAAALDALGMADAYVPRARGGALGSFEELGARVRCVARRDLAVAAAHATTLLGALPVWIAGTGAQADALASSVRAGARLALAMTEPAHGSDLFAVETAAVEDGGGHVLSGEKWLISNAARCDAVLVLARTDPRGGPRGFSLFRVLRDELDELVPGAPMHGIRGADVSGFRLRGRRIPADRCVGGAGRGLEVVLKSLQINRVVVPTLSLGALDTALRQALALARTQTLDGRPLVEHPWARRTLSESFAELLAAEALVRAGARCVQALPERLPVWSAVVKALVPSRVDASLRGLASMLGMPALTRDGRGPFEKLLRDHGFVALVDGSLPVNLGALALELPRMALGSEGDARYEPRGRRLFDLRAPLPDFDPERLQLASRGGDDLRPTLAHAREVLRALPDGAVRGEVRSAIERATEALGDELEALLARARGAGRPRAGSAESFEAAETYACLHAATACLGVWLANRGGLDGFFDGGEWLALALAALRGDGGPAVDAATRERVFERLVELDEDDRVLGLEPVPTG